MRRWLFVYTGMGPQWWGMGQELVRTEKIVQRYAWMRSTATFNRSPGGR